MYKGFVISLFDESGNMVRPWAEAGYRCYCYDLKNKYNTEYIGDGYIHYARATLNRHEIEHIAAHITPTIIFGFPPCDDLAVCGAKHFENKRQANPKFQEEAVALARLVELYGELSGSRWMAENPISRLATLWRKPDHYFHPFEYGGYLPENDVHPRWPDYIVPRDAYSKRTSLWTGNGFVMPERKPVEPVDYGKSKQWGKLGGKSAKTKQIRSETPRGFARAVFEANHETV